MAKTRTRYVCSKCGWQGPRMMGRCPNCSEFGTIDPEVIEVRKASTSKNVRAPMGASRAKPQKLGAVDLKEQPRMFVPMGEFSRVLGGGLVPGSISLIGGEPGIGKCLTGDTRVFNPKTGDYLTIESMMAGEHHVLSLDDERYCLSPDAVTHFHERGHKAIIEVETRLGNRLRCTPEHPILTETGWQAIGSLELGSRIASPRALPYFGSASLPEAEIKLVAYMLGDGSAQSQISITSMQPETAIDVQQIAKHFSMSTRVYDKKNNRAKQYRFVSLDRDSARNEVADALNGVKQSKKISWTRWADLAQISVEMLYHYKNGKGIPRPDELVKLAEAVDLSIDELASNARDRGDKTTLIARYLENIGIRYSTAIDKAIPDIIFRLSRDQVALFLKILFSCDGSVYVSNHKLAGISYSTISRQLVEDVKHLLLRFGFVPRIRTKVQTVNQEPYTAYELQLLGTTTVIQFLDEIGIYGRDEAKVKIASLPIPQRPSSQWDTIPTGVRFYQHIQVAAKTTNFSEISRQVGTIVKNRRHERPLTRYMVEKIATAYPTDDYLNSLAYGDVYWDEIVSIEDAGHEIVYDLTIANNPNFVANGLIVHNS
ncbi:MAG: LAGLIDADG family homing endonuclease, partial [Phototrophicaceae bacterium]